MAEKSLDNQSEKWRTRRASSVTQSERKLENQRDSDVISGI
jgi:hypothetical protein